MGSAVVSTAPVGVPPAVEPGILPGGLSCELRGQLRVQRSHSGRKMPPSTAAKMAAATPANQR